MPSFAGLSYLTIRSSVYIILIEILIFLIFTISDKLHAFTYVGNLANVDFISMNKQQEHTSSCYSPLLDQFQFKFKLFTVERAAKTLHQMSPYTPVSVPAKITWISQGFIWY